MEVRLKQWFSNALDQGPHSSRHSLQTSVLNVQMFGK